RPGSLPTLMNPLSKIGPPEQSGSELYSWQLQYLCGAPTGAEIATCAAAASATALPPEASQKAERPATAQISRNMRAFVMPPTREILKCTASAASDRAIAVRSPALMADSSRIKGERTRARTRLHSAMLGHG